jgi:hypothetical protein
MLCVKGAAGATCGSVWMLCVQYVSISLARPTQEHRHSKAPPHNDIYLLVLSTARNESKPTVLSVLGVTSEQHRLTTHSLVSRRDRSGSVDTPADVY